MFEITLNFRSVVIEYKNKPSRSTSRLIFDFPSAILSKSSMVSGIALLESGTGNREQGTADYESGANPRHLRALGNAHQERILGFRNVLTFMRSAIVGIYPLIMGRSQ